MDRRSFFGKVVGGAMVLFGVKPKQNAAEVSEWPDDLWLLPFNDMQATWLAPRVYLPFDEVKVKYRLSDVSYDSLNRLPSKLHQEEPRRHLLQELYDLGGEG